MLCQICHKSKHERRQSPSQSPRYLYPAERETRTGTRALGTRLKRRAKKSLEIVHLTGLSEKGLRCLLLLLRILSTHLGIVSEREKKKRIFFFGQCHVIQRYFWAVYGHAGKKTLASVLEIHTENWRLPRIFKR